jgi:PilZ domain-containing protein
LRSPLSCHRIGAERGKDFAIPRAYSLARSNRPRKGRTRLMSEVLVYERASTSFAASLAKRGHHIVYRANEANHCPGCGRSQWFVGRMSAECGFCGTAVPLAETGRQESLSAAPRSPAGASPAEQRRFPRMPAKGRKLKLLIDGSPTNFALQNISEGGVMGANVAELAPGANVHVRFEGGILVAAVVKWVENGSVGLAFVDPIILDRSDQPRN